MQFLCSCIARLQIQGATSEKQYKHNNKYLNITLGIHLQFSGYDIFSNFKEIFMKYVMF